MLEILLTKSTIDLHKVVKNVKKHDSYSVTLKIAKSEDNFVKRVILPVLTNNYK